MEIKPNFITDSDGNKKSVVLSLSDFEKLIEREELEIDNELLQESLANDDGKRYSKKEAFSMIDKERVKNGL